MNKPIYIERPEVERKYKRLEKLGQELRIPVPSCHLELKVIMPDGSIPYWYRQRSHSWTRNAYNGMLVTLAWNVDGTTYGDGDLKVKTTSGVSNNYGTTTYSKGGANSSVSGIQVGSGNTAESFEDYVLATLITSGTGAGQLSYVAGEDLSLS